MNNNFLVTGFNDRGKSIVLTDIDEPKFLEFDSVPGFSVSKLWSTSSSPVVGRAPPVAIARPRSLVPAPGETRFTQIMIPPDSVWDGVSDWEAVGAEYAAKLPGLAETFEVDAPGMHTTETIDYIIVIAGELILELDDDARHHLRTGDVVVQNGTRHAWRNPTGQPACMLAIMIGAVTEPGEPARVPGAPSSRRTSAT